MSRSDDPRPEDEIRRRYFAEQGRPDPDAPLPELFPPSPALEEAEQILAGMPPVRKIPVGLRAPADSMPPRGPESRPWLDPVGGTNTPLALAIRGLEVAEQWEQRVGQRWEERYPTFFALSHRLSGLGVVACLLAGVAVVSVDEYLVADLCWFLAILIVLAKILHWRRLEQRPIVNLVAKSGLALLSLAGLFGFIQWTNIKKAEKPWSSVMVRPVTKPTPPSQAAATPAVSEAPTAIYMETRQVPLPLRVQPGTDVHVLSLNRSRITSPHSTDWGFYHVSNDDKNESLFPNKKVMDRAAQAKNPAVAAWRADISNHGPTNMLDVVVNLTLWFGPSKAAPIEYRVVVSPLDAGKPFTFYLINDCSENVAGAWPDDVSVDVLGESARRTVPLRRRFVNPIEQLVFFMGSTTPLVGDFPCGNAKP